MAPSDNHGREADRPLLRRTTFTLLHLYRTTMRPLLLPLAAVALLLHPQGLRAQQEGQVPRDPEPVSAGRATAQVTLGAVGTIGGFVGGGLATRWVARRSGASDERASRLAYIGAWTGAALATPVAPMLVGSQGDVHGSYPAALAGTLVGGAASLAIVTAGRHGAFDCRWCGPVRVLAGVSAFVLPSLGATIAFNQSRERD